MTLTLTLALTLTLPLTLTGKDKSASEEEKSAIAKLIAGFDEGKAARQVDLSEEELESVKGLGLLSAKPIIYAANVADEDLATGNAMVEQVRPHPSPNPNPEEHP